MVVFLVYCADLNSAIMEAPSRRDAAVKSQEDQLLKAALDAEALMDAEIVRLNSLQADDLEVLRERKMRLMKLEYEQQQQWIAKGHGKYSELQDEKDFFANSKRSRNVICHFYRSTTWRCQIVDKHLQTIAEKHLAAKVVKLNAEKAPFLWFAPLPLLCTRITLTCLI
jgi:hypothetical protein